MGLVCFHVKPESVLGKQFREEKFTVQRKGDSVKNIAARLISLITLCLLLMVSSFDLFARPPKLRLTSNPQFRVGIFSAPQAGDDFLKFLKDLSSEANIRLLHEQKLTRGTTEKPPWSGSYWPHYRGLLAHRYGDRSIPKSNLFLENFESFQRRSADSFLSAADFDKLSPAEKYDLLIGDRNWTLTKHMWQQGQNIYNQYGGVQKWTGICHGWAAANQYNRSAPVNTVSLVDVTGSYLITFYPHDIRGLQSYLWAESGPNAIQAGKRCREIPLSRDEFLRPIDEACLDNNPMTWHLALTNRVGKSAKSLVMDSSRGSEVWNYPIWSYDYQYFNPKTLEPSQAFTAALIPIKEFTNDRFRSHRSPEARFILGINMDVFFPGLIEPSTRKDPDLLIQSKNYIYDLELDENLKVVGGEWYSADTPDFLWTIPENQKALTVEDRQFAELSWELLEPLPGTIAEKAIVATSRGKVLSTIVDKLFQKSIEVHSPEISVPR